MVTAYSPLAAGIIAVTRSPKRSNQYLSTNTVLHRQTFLVSPFFGWGGGEWGVRVSPQSRLHPPRELVGKRPEGRSTRRCAPSRMFRRAPRALYPVEIRLRVQPGARTSRRGGSRHEEQASFRRPADPAFHPERSRAGLPRPRAAPCPAFLRHPWSAGETYRETLVTTEPLCCSHHPVTLSVRALRRLKCWTRCLI